MVRRERKIGVYWHDPKVRMCINPPTFKEKEEKGTQK
jgi:hypothetical protein